MTRKAVRPQDQTVYEKYKNLVYRYLRKLYPEAEESLQRRILGRVWEEAGRLDILSGTEDERKVLTALLALTEQEIHQARMREVWRDARQRKTDAENGSSPAEEA